MRIFSHNQRDKKLKIPIFRAIKNESWRFISGQYCKSVKLFFTRLSVLVLTPVALASFGYLVLAQSDSNQYNIEVVNVFPGTITADKGWKNIETLTIQNLGSFSLYHEFNAINSAYFELGQVSILQVIENRQASDSTGAVEPEARTFAPEETIPADDVLATTSEEQPIGGAEPFTEFSATPTPGNAPSTTVPEIDGVTTSTVSVPARNPATTTEPKESATTTVLNRVTKTFAFLFSSATEFLSFANESTTTPTVQPISSESDSDSATTSTTDVVEVQESVSPATSSQNATTTASSSEPVVPETEVTNTPIVATATEKTPTPASTSTTTSSVTPAPNIPVSVNDKVATSVEPIIDDCEDECANYRITLSDFGLPIFDDGKILDGLQLKMSFASKMKVTRDESQWLSSRYSLNGGESWAEGGEVLISDEVSNSTNGGYFVLPLPRIEDPAVLDSLVIELIYSDDPRGLEGLYIDSVWLELFTLDAPEPTDVSELLLDNGYDNEVLSGDTLVLPDGEKIDFEFTDENADETLIIKSDKVRYAGLSETTLYFNVTNTSNDDDTFSVQTYFPAGVGEVVSLEEWVQNKPKEVVVPEYRPFVYHCEAGWEATNAPENVSLEDFSRLFAPDVLESEVGDATEVPEVVREIEATTSASSSVADPDMTVEEDVPAHTPTTTYEVASTTAPLLMSTVTESPALDGEVAVGSDDEDFVPTYACRDTSVVRTCDSITGANTECRVDSVKVREHQVTQYVPSWDKKPVQSGYAPDQRGLVKRVLDWFGFGPNKKPVPDAFEPRSHTDGSHTIAPGETKYFKMEIAFPPLSDGEFWIEAIGESEYGLLDPFWSSQWEYRLPITIDNTGGASELLEQQVFLELDSSLTDFWSNVNDDGSDIRFVQETVTGSEEDWYETGWSSRLPITIQSSQIDETMTDFPVYVDLSDLGSEFFNTVRSDGGDIRITQSDGQTERPIELVTIDTGSETGELHFSGDVSSTTDTVFYIYFGNSDAEGYAETDTYGAQNVWGTEYIAVYHMEEAAAGRGTADLYQDSTDNEYDADDQLNSTGKSGKLGQGQEVDAQGDANEYLLLPSDIVNSETELTFAYWMNSSDGGNQALINGGSGNEYLLYLTGGGTNLDVFPGGAITVPDLTNSSWRHVLVTRDANANQWRAYVDGQFVGQDSPGLGTLSIPADCLVIGLEQDGSCLSSGDTSQHLNASIDEMRFWNTIPTAGEISATFRNQSTTTDFYATSTVETFMNTSFSELDFWLQHFSTSTDEADIWVQVDSLPAGASTTIYLYYGNAGATSASDEFAPFTYSTTTDLYYVVHDDLSAAINLYSYIDNNVITVDGGTPFTLDAGEVTTVSGYSSNTVISALGPITTLTSSGDGAEPVVPIAFASTTQMYPSTRGSEEFDIYAPFADADVDIYSGSGGTPDVSLTVTSGTVSEQANATGNATILESDNPILVYAKSSNANDATVLYPPTTRDLYGMATRDYFFSTINTGGEVAEFCSVSGTSTTTGMTRGTQYGNGSCDPATYDDGAGEGVRFTNITEPITAIQQRDSDGTDSSVFLPEMELGASYIIPADMNYVAIVCSPRLGESEITVYSSAGAEVDSGTCTPAGVNEPGTLLFDGGNGDALLYSQGYRFESTNGVPFWIMYEDNDSDDETNTWGAPQGRKYTEGLNYSFGVQEVTIDAQYEQLSFGWYENINQQTPTSTWPLGEGNFATEGVAITGQGAVNVGDTLRLRMNLRANVATGSASSTAFKLQYAQADASQCSVATNWFDVGEVGSTTAAFSGYNNAGVTDGSELSATVLATSTVFGTYEESNLSAFIPNVINPNETAEWDWSLEVISPATNANYCFRMVRSTGNELVTYTAYPELETAGPPLAPTLISFFDNERTASSSPPVLEFAASDLAGDGIRYQIQVDEDIDFSVPDIDRDSQTHFGAGEFENLNTPSNKNPFNSGERIRFTSISNLSASTSYWWRVRGRDTNGSNTWGEWSTAQSFTTDGSVTVSEWHQTTGHQFTTNTLVSLSTSTGAVSVSGSSGTMTSTPIDFDDATIGNAWGLVTWEDTETSGTIMYQVEYLNGSSWELIPDSQIPNNSVGTSTGPINLLDLDTDTYNQIRLVANFSGTTLSIEEWTVVWGQRVEEPTLLDPFDNEKIATTTPTLRFSSTDPQGDTLDYEVSWSTDNTFVSSTTRSSGALDPGFVGSSPYASGATVSYEIQSGEAFTDGQTIWWRARARDTFGGNAWSPWSDADSFTVDTTVSVSTWFQTTAEQFQTGTLSGLSASTTGGLVTNDAQVGEYGTVVVTNGSSTEVNLQRSYNNPVVVASVRYAKSVADGSQRYARVQEKTTDTFTLYVSNYDNTVTGTTTVDYMVVESGDWTLDDGGSGTRLVAGTVSVSTVSGRTVPTNPGGTTVAFGTPFSGSAPAVITTVSSNNDSDWVLASTYDGSNTVNGPTTAGFTSFLNLNHVSPISHGPEDVDYVAIAQGNGTVSGSEFHAVVDTNAVGPNPTAITFSPSFSGVPQVTLAHQDSQDGGDGGYIIVDTDNPATSNEVYLAVEEDGPGNTRVGHNNEDVSVIAFENSSGVLETQAGDGLAGTITSPAIPFSDGAGPKFERALFSATNLGGSTTTVQIQYQTGPDTWALIPDSAIPGNSVGTTTTPIDLTNVDVGTYDTIRLVATLTCSDSACPELNDWTVEWSEGVPVTGTIREYDRTTNVTSGTVQVAVNGTPGNTGSIAGDGTWSINNVTAFDGDVVTVWVTGAADANEAVAVFVYDGSGDMTGVELFEQHVSLSADENGSVTNALLGAYDNSVSTEEDIFFDVDDVTNDLEVCAVGSCSQANLYIGSGNTYIPDTSGSGNVTTHDLINNGTFELDANTMRVSGSWDDNATTDLTGSTVIFTATSTSETLDDTDNVLDFDTLRFGETSGSATWKTFDPLDINGALSMSFGTLDRSSSTITVARNLSTGANGFWSGISTTTFDGNTTAQWSDSNSVSQDIGHVVINGAAKTVTLQSNVRASSVTIEADDALNGGGSYTLAVGGNFTNNNTFSAQTSTLALVGTGTNAVIDTGGSALFNLRASTTGGGSVSFTETNITMLGTLSIATGTVTLPTGITSIGGSFLNTGGFFAHNNGTVRFTGTGNESIQLNGTAFLNHLYDVSFTGNSTWSFLDTNATTSNTMSISNGTVVFPTGELSVARNFAVSGSGAFDNNGGEVVLLIEGNDTVTTNGSAFNDVRVRQGSGGSGSWYADQWLYRIPVTVRASAIDDDLTNFPVYVDLADFPSSFFSNLYDNGGDIRVTASDGVTEVAREIVSASTTAETGELYFLASSTVSSTTDTTFYLYYGNATATDYAVTATYGAEAVWANGYVLVAHLNDETTSTVVNSANGSLDGTKETAGNPAETNTGQIYEAQDLGGTVDIEFGNVGQNATNITISAWFNADDLTGGGAGDNGPGQYGATIFSGHSSGNYTWLTAGGTGNGGSVDELRFCGFDSDAACDVTSGANLQTGEWTYVSATAVDGGSTNVRVNAANVLSGSSNGGGTWNSNSFIGDLRSDRNINFDGEIDEVQISNVIRSVAWQDATYRNQSTTTDFYAVGTPQEDSVRTFADTNTTVEGNVVIESGTAVFPTGNLSVGGSFDNDDKFDANGGTVSFTATATAKTIAPGSSSFYNLTINGDGGDMAIIENATVTNAINLIDAGTFTVNPGLTLESTGTFTSDIGGASTTWTGSTLLLSGGGDFAINATSSSGDQYATLTITDDGDISMWNSSSTVYDLQDTASLYSQDHSGTDGDLYIFGDYVRESGTEYWSYATDFDGTDLSGGNERQVNVRVENGASVTASSSILEMIGSSTASSTIDAQSGSFTLISNNATVTAEYFTMTGTNADGFQLVASSTVTSLDSAQFSIPGSSAAITVDASTIDTTPASQFFNTDFVTAGGNVNVTLSGSPTSYWWFRDGTGDRYGEAFDNADGTGPGSIRWDDSNYQINATGTVYADDGSSPLGGPTCDGATNAVTIVVDGGSYTDSVPCDGLDGSFSFTDISYTGDATLAVFLDDTLGGERGSLITRTPTADIANLDLYVDRVITRHEDAAPMTIARLAVYDENDDSDLRFVAATGTSHTLTVRPDTELYVWATSTFTPGGTVTLESGGTGNIFDGSLHLGPDAVFTGAGTTTYQVGGSLILEPGADLITASSTFDFTATTTGKTITASSTIDFNEMQFTGIGGGWNLNTDITAAADIEVVTGTLTGTGNITLTNGSFYGDGLVSLGGGTALIERSNTLGGAQGWTFNDLTLGSGSVVGTTTPGGTATNTVAGILTISNAHFLDAGSSAWNLTGGGNVFVETGTFLEDTSTVRYGGVTGNNVLSTSYYNLIIEAAGGSPTYTAGATGVQILNDLRVGGGGVTTFTLNSNDPVVAIGGNLYVAPNGTFVGSNSAILTVSGDWDNDGVFTSSGGLVDFDSADGFTIAAGDSSFGAVTITGAGAASIIEHATSTGSWTFTATANVTVNPGQRLAVGSNFTNEAGGAATTWTGSTLHLFGSGQYEINASTTQDEYSTLSAAAGTHIRMWNSSSSVYTTATGGSIYSMDHADVTGELYIYGDYIRNSGTDYWSFATDFDGTNLTGSERTVDVFVEVGGSVSYGGGTLRIIGTSTASTSIMAQGVGDYAFDITAGTLNAQYYQFADLDSDGLTFTGSPTVTTLTNGTWVLDTTGDAALTVDGTVIDQNPGKNILNNQFATTSGVTNAVNVRTTGSTVSSWRYNAHTGDVDGENFDDDNGDPGYIVWDNSTTTYAIGGTVYQSDRTSPSTACSATANIVLVVNTVALASTTCDGAGDYTFADINFDSNDIISVYINDEPENAVTVTKEPISSVSNLDLYEDHVIVRHESTNPLNIFDMTVWDASDDSDIIFTATDASPDTLVLDPDSTLFVWNNKEFEPTGNITTGGGGGTALDGTVWLANNAILTLNNGETHDLGGDFEAAPGATVVPATAAIDFTSAGAGRTIDTNESGLYDVTISGAGTFTATDTPFTVQNDLTLSAGTLTLPNATTSIGGSLITTTGSFVANSGVMDFTGAGSETITVAGSDFAALRFSGSGSWNMTDTNATTTESFTMINGAVTLPSGTLVVRGDFQNIGGTFAHNNGTVEMSTSSNASVLATGSDFNALTFTGGGDYVMEDDSLTLLDTLTVDTATVTLPSTVSTSTLSIGGSLDASNGVFDSGTGTVLFNSADAGETIDAGLNHFYNVNFGSGGGWTIVSDATTTNDFSITAAGSFVQAPNTTLAVSGVFTNRVGAVTTWTDSVLRLISGTDYSMNSKSNTGATYGELVIGEAMDIKMWRSSAATTTLASTTSSSLYSQDHADTDGYLYIYGQFDFATGTQYWNNAVDFDGTALGGGSERQVQVFVVDSAASSITVSANGSLQMIGAADATTTVQALGAGSYSFAVTGGALNAQYYALRNMDGNGLSLSGTPTITNLSDGDFEVSVDTGTAITLASTTLNANPSKLFDNIRFEMVAPAATATNVNLDATTTNAWTFRDHFGDIAGEDYDIDGVSNCGSMRWDDSACLLTEQTHYRWRNDDGGLDAPDSVWYNASWDKRQRVRIQNNDNVTYATTTVKLTVPYDVDADMQPDFEDLRFTDSDGTTLIDHWVEDYTASTEATVWVEVFNLPASGNKDIFMYFDNVSTTTVSSSTATFVAIDDFEDNNLDEYIGGDTAKFQTEAASAFGGSYGVAPVTDSNFTNDGIARFDQTVSQGQIIRFMQKIDTDIGSGDETCVLFGVQSPVTDNENYAVCLVQFLGERIEIVRDAERGGNSGGSVELASTTVNFSNGWYEVEVDWQTDNTIFVSLYTEAGSLVATTSATDATYTSGGYGFSYWGQTGGWDSLTSRYRTESTPTVYFGAKQTDGGATWAQALDTPANSFEIGDVARLRIAIENSGLDITDQAFQLEYAAKGAAPSCEAVSDAVFASVPNQASCGSSAICMQTTSNYTNNDATTDLLFDTEGRFTAGEAIESPSSITSAIDVNQNEYTELEFAITPTVNATSSSYCLRLTDDGDGFDSYLSVPELQISFLPTISAWSLNNGANIIINPGGTTTIYATGTVTDLNGYTDFSSQPATTTIYRSGVNETCTEDPNNCYRSTSPECSYSACAGSTCTLSCTADIYYFAEATDFGTYAGQTWRSFVEIVDSSGATTSAQAPSVDLQTFIAIEIASGTEAINYGALAPQTNTADYNATTTVENVGNGDIDISLEGTDLSDGGTSLIDVDNQKFATTTFSYSACTVCGTLATTTSQLEVDLNKPTSTSTPITDDVYWGIQIPFGVAAAPHSGLNTFYAVND